MANLLTLRASEFGVPFKNAGKWGWSRHEDGEEARFASNIADTKERAKDKGKAEALSYGDDRFFVAPVVEPRVRIKSPDTLVMDASERMFERYGYLSETWPPVDLQAASGKDSEIACDLDEEFRQMVGRWLTKHNLWPEWSDIGKPEGFDVTEADAEAADAAAAAAEEM